LLQMFVLNSYRLSPTKKITNDRRHISCYEDSDLDVHVEA
jgi:hypothetical protein